MAVGNVCRWNEKSVRLSWSGTVGDDVGCSIGDSSLGTVHVERTAVVCSASVVR